MRLHKPKPPMCICRSQIHRWLGIMSPSLILMHRFKCTPEVMEYLDLCQQYRIDARICTRSEWEKYYWRKRLEDRHDHN